MLKYLSLTPVLNVAMKLFNKLWPKKNILANRFATPISLEEVKQRISLPLEELNIDKQDFLAWQHQFFPEGEALFKTTFHKKLLELYISYTLLNISDSDVYVDAAGGQYSYASRVNCKSKIIQDIRLSDKLKQFHGPGVTYLDCSCADFPLPDLSVNKISCHHSIEHFQQQADIDFIKELQRILAPGGKCVIVPLFISDAPFLITDKTSFKKWSETGEWVIDETASLPGGSGSGHFSRVYSPETLQNRLLDQLDANNFTSKLVAVKMNGEAIPNENHFMKKNQAIINYYYKALVIERIN